MTKKKKAQKKKTVTKPVEIVEPTLSSSPTMSPSPSPTDEELETVTESLWQRIKSGFRRLINVLMSF